MKFKQMEFDFVFPSNLLPCNHERCFPTDAVVPAGLACFDCDEVILQYIPQSPEQLGYVSADWAYLYEREAL